MVSLHGILAELGLEPSARPAQHPDPALDGQWTTEPRFDPIEGASYELAFTRIPVRDNARPVIKRVRIDGPSAEDWFDLEAQRPLDRALYAYTVKAYRRLDADPNLH
jgi:hypothetical protein